MPPDRRETDAGGAGAVGLTPAISATAERQRRLRSSFLGSSGRRGFALVAENIVISKGGLGTPGGNAGSPNPSAGVRSSENDLEGRAPVDAQ